MTGDGSNNVLSRFEDGTSQVRKRPTGTGDRTAIHPDNMYPKEKSERAENARAAARKQIADQLLELCDNGHAAAVERGYLSMKAVPPPPSKHGPLECQLL